jgi:O-methyltransferase
MDSLPYLELLKKSLVGLDRAGLREHEPVGFHTLSKVKRFCLRRLLPRGVKLAKIRPLHQNVREHGKDVPLYAPARMGLWRLHNLEVCARQVILDQIPGDFLETGAWRGGGSILLKGVLQTYGQSDRSVWLVDDYTTDRKPDRQLVTLQQVKQYFDNYDLLDDRVNICDGMPSANQAPKQLALVRIADTDPAKLQASLRACYGLLQAGGYLQIDRYYSDAKCREIVDDFRVEQDERTPLEKVDWSGVFWRKPRMINKKELPDHPVWLDFTIQQHASEKQNFFHHVWGYLLPALHLYLTENKPHLLFQSGGPYMDPVTTDLFKALEIPHSIIRDWEVVPDEINRKELSRWEPVVFRLAEQMSKKSARPEVLKYSDSGYDIPEPLKTVRDFVLHKLVDVVSPSFPAGSIILLDRAAENAIYRRGGLARANAYGKGHRALMGIPEVVKELKDQGVMVVHYAPNTKSYTQQLIDFYHCGGVVGIRGAEFAHLIWMRPGAKVLMYQPAGMNPRNIQQPLAQLMGLSFRQIEVDSKYPALRSADIMEHFNL